MIIIDEKVLYLSKTTTNMGINDFLSISAIILAPVLALQIQKWLEKYREDRERKMSIFRTLMSTRVSRVSIEHVESLNMIDIEFYNKKYKDVIQAWRKYHDHLSFGNPDHDDWINKNDDLFIDLLSRMGKSLGYKFDDVMLKRTAYSPVAHGNLEYEQQIIRKGYADLFTGNSAFSIRLIPDEKNKGEELI